jgi:hypothetical protein
MNKNLILLPNCSGKVNFEGEPQKAIGYYSHETNKRLNTICIYTNNFTGRIYILGTTKINPSDDDWGVVEFNNGCDYLEFNNLCNHTPKRVNTFINIEGSYTWLKAKMVRDNYKLLENPTEIKKHLPHITSGYCIESFDKTHISNHLVNVLPDPSSNLKYFGNVEAVTLSY